MRNRVILVLPALLLALAGCGRTVRTGNALPPRSTGRVTIRQGIWGDIWFWKGDFMPPAATGTITPVRRTVLIHRLTTLDQVEPANPDQRAGPFFSRVNTGLVRQTESDARGFFQVELPEGDYSIFVRENGALYANRTEAGGAIFPVHVAAGRPSGIQFDINYQATY